MICNKLCSVVFEIKKIIAYTNRLVSNTKDRVARLRQGSLYWKVNKTYMTLLIRLSDGYGKLRDHIVNRLNYNHCNATNI